MIRPANITDLPAILEIERTSFDLPHWSKADFEHAIAPGEGILQRALLVEETDGQIRGIGVAAALTGFFPIEAEIQNLAVARQHRRSGVGRELLLGLLAWAGEHHASVIRLEVRVSNAGAIGLYRELGFAQTGTRRAYYQNPPEDAAIMEKTLR